jgi:hypothetical protein
MTVVLMLGTRSLGVPARARGLPVALSLHETCRAVRIRRASRHGPDAGASFSRERYDQVSFHSSIFVTGLLRHYTASTAL